MHLHQLKYFVAVVDTGSVTGAAERCFISQPSLSRQLHKLEDGVGKKLFLRAKGKLTPTDAGKALYQHARDILATVAHAKRRVDELDDDTGGRVAIGILPTLAPFMLPSILPALSRTHPNATVMVREEVSNVIVDDLARADLDVLIEVLPFDDNDIEVTRLFTDEFCVTVHKNNPLAQLNEISIEALGDAPFILLDDVHCLAQQIEQYCFRKFFTPRVLFQASQLETVKRLIELQHGISLLPRISIKDEPHSDIFYIKLKGATPSREVVLATAKDRYLSSAAKQFIVIAEEQYREQGAA